MITPQTQVGFPNLPVPTSVQQPEEKRYESLFRVLRLMQLIEGRSYCPPLQVMAQDLGVCTRTIRRYLDVMSTAGLFVPPLDTEREGYERELEPRGGVASRHVTHVVRAGGVR